MGNARWNNDDYQTYATATNYRSYSREKVFSHHIDHNLDPRNVRVGKGDRKGLQLRESIISETNPDPTPIILGLDVTGSMGEVAEQIAKDELPKLMTAIHQQQVVTDPHVMFMAIDDVHVIPGTGALQVSYFEPDLKIIEQLRKMWLVNLGGGNDSESYDLAWYFAGKHTYLQNFEMTGKPGFLFTIGDESFPTQTNSARELETVFGPGQYEAVTPLTALSMAQQKFQVFHISIVKRGYRLVGWDENLASNHLKVEVKDVSRLSDVVLATMKIAEGASIHEVIGNDPVLKRAFENALRV